VRRSAEALNFIDAHRSMGHTDLLLETLVSLW
jgi:hypothetical protein